MPSHEHPESENQMWGAASPAGHRLGSMGAAAIDAAMDEPAAKYAPTQAPAKTQPSQADHAAPFPHYAYPAELDIEGERVTVNSAEEANEAREIIRAIQAEYGIEISSQKGIAALRQRYARLPPAIQELVRADVWQLKELRALRRALAHFAPLLGKQRESSNSASIPQQVTSIGKLNQAATENSPTGKLDGGETKQTMGEYFGQGRNLSLFSAGTNRMVDGFDNQNSLEATSTHEIAHALLSYRLVDFVAEVGYWTDAFEGFTRPGGEKPITEYAASRPDEDLAETVKFFFLKPDELKKRCPKRYDFMEKEIASWHANHPAK